MLYRSGISNAIELGQSGPFLGRKIYSGSGAAMLGGPHSCPLREYIFKQTYVGNPF